MYFRHGADLAQTKQIKQPTSYALEGSRDAQSRGGTTRARHAILYFCLSAKPRLSLGVIHHILILVRLRNATPPSTPHWPGTRCGVICIHEIKIHLHVYNGADSGPHMWRFDWNRPGSVDWAFSRFEGLEPWENGRCSSARRQNNCQSYARQPV